MPQPSKESPAVATRRRERQDRIVAGAVALFARQGLHHTSMQQIADEIGMSVGSLYQYLPNKQAIITEALAAKDRANVAETSRVTDAASLWHLLSEGVADLGTLPATQSALNCEISAEAARDAELAARLTDQFEHARTLLADAIGAAEPGLDEAERRTRAEVLILVQTGLTALHASGAPVADLAALGRRALASAIGPAPDLPTSRPTPQES